MSLRSALPLLLLLAASATFAAPPPARGEGTIKIKNASAKYELEVRVEGCGAQSSGGDDHCEGPARVRLYRKGSRRPFQVLRLRNVELYKGTAAYSPATSAEPRGLYAEEYTFVFEDFDFDGEEDLAICNGRNGGYGGPSYDVYLFDKGAQKFVENRRLSGLTEGPYLGLFFPDPKKRRLSVHSKSGCCYHETEVYRVVGGRPILSEKVTEDATLGAGAGEGFVLVTTRKKVGGRWVVRKRRERLREESPAAGGGPE